MPLSYGSEPWDRPKHRNGKKAGAVVLIDAPPNGLALTGFATGRQR
ncbi:hypothetical protein FP2506_18609 [Fulvimarina pelagi HTCC2506]|uniref:Uncharacterized protein n=1 Tax=Fulvimarina pelagi HTCC2506 TaxID=314231 RepID=Q0G0R1_9HYPH|nr:hypothetical protein FP2506_18609 [Fulvimarina pelagi HTCC2506]